MSNKNKANKSNKSWQAKQNRDPYVIKSRNDGYRSRAAYKLLEINEKDHILTPGMTVVDLGSAPGSWSQVASDIVGIKGKVVALDILDMVAITNVEFIQGDFTTDEVFNQLIATLEQTTAALQGMSNRKIDVVISDMAPNLSGNVTSDQARSAHLVLLAYDLALKVLKPKGSLLVKVFYGSSFNELVQTLKNSFDKVVVRKPKASRAESKEVYLLATGYNL